MAIVSPPALQEPHVSPHHVSPPALPEPPVSPPSGHGEEGAAGPQGRSLTPRTVTFAPGSSVSHSLTAAATLITLIRSVAPQQPLPGGQMLPEPPIACALPWVQPGARCTTPPLLPARLCLEGLGLGQEGVQTPTPSCSAPPGGETLWERGGSAPSPFSRPLCSLAAHPPEHQVPRRLLRGALGCAGRPARCSGAAPRDRGAPTRVGGPGIAPGPLPASICRWTRAPLPTDCVMFSRLVSPHPPPCPFFPAFLFF